jgi:hypothetical protein
VKQVQFQEQHVLTHVMSVHDLDRPALENIAPVAISGDLVEISPIFAKHHGVYATVLSSSVTTYGKEGLTRVYKLRMSPSLANKIHPGFSNELSYGIPERFIIVDDSKKHESNQHGSECLLPTLDSASTVDMINTDRFFIPGTIRDTQIAVTFNDSDASAIKPAKSGLVLLATKVPNRYIARRMLHHPRAKRTIISIPKMRDLGYTFTLEGDHTSVCKNGVELLNIARKNKSDGSVTKVDRDNYVTEFDVASDSIFVHPDTLGKMPENFDACGDIRLPPLNVRQECFSSRNDTQARRFFTQAGNFTTQASFPECFSAQKPRQECFSTRKDSQECDVRLPPRSDSQECNARLPSPIAVEVSTTKACASVKHSADASPSGASVVTKSTPPLATFHTSDTLSDDSFVPATEPHGAPTAPVEDENADESNRLVEGEDCTTLHTMLEKATEDLSEAKTNIADAEEEIRSHHSAAVHPGRFLYHQGFYRVPPDFGKVPHRPPSLPLHDLQHSAARQVQLVPVHALPGSSVLRPYMPPARPSPPLPRLPSASRVEYRHTVLCTVCARRADYFVVFFFFFFFFFFFLNIVCYRRRG